MRGYAAWPRGSQTGGAPCFAAVRRPTPRRPRHSWPRTDGEEDGVTLALFDEIGAETRRFVEIGSGPNGGVCGILAAELGWSGLMIDANEAYVTALRQRLPRGRVDAVHAWATRETLDALLADHGLTGELDLLSIDVDGVDYWLWESLSACSPRVVAIESNSSFGPNRSVVVAYDPEFRRRGVPGVKGTSTSARRCARSQTWTGGSATASSSSSPAARRPTCCATTWRPGSRARRGGRVPPLPQARTCDPGRPRRIPAQDRRRRYAARRPRPRMTPDAAFGRLRRLIPLSARRVVRKLVPKREIARTAGLLLGPVPEVPDAPACELCGSTRRRALYRHKRTIALGCEACGVVESFPRPDDEAVRAYYESNAGWERSKAWPEDEALAEFLERRRRVYAVELDVLLTCVSPPSAANRAAPRVLDYGCGIGIVLDVLASRGWTTTGLEPAPKSATLAAQRHVLIDELPREPTYDLIVAAHVLEHVPHPLETVRELYRATLPGGQIYVGVPSFDRLAEHGLFRHLLNKQHLFAYTFTAMANLLRRGGYEDVRLLTGPAWEPVRDSVRSMRTLASRPSGSSAGEPSFDAGPETDDADTAPLDDAIRALAGYCETELGQAYLTGGLSKLREARARLAGSGPWPG